MGRIDHWINKRKKIAEIYDNHFKGLKKPGTGFANSQDAIYFRYLVYVENRDDLKEKLKEKDIYTGYGVLEGLHQLQGLPDDQYPNTSNYLKHILSLPIYPSLEEKDIERIAKQVLNILK